MIPYGRQQIEQSDIDAVVATLKSDWLTSGPRVEEFEKQFAEFVGASHAVAVNSGTAALHLATMVAELGPGDRLLTSPITFLASANCAAYVGATPDFVDIDRASRNLCPRALEAAWQPDTKAVVAVDFAGQPCDIQGISEVARPRGAIVIEDACHGIGSAIRKDGKAVRSGGHDWADITTFSFHPVKTMTTGEGGMLVTNDEELAKKAYILRNHGMTREASEFTGLGSGGAQFQPGPWYYEMHELGFNYRITDLQCALGISQLSRLPQFIKRRQEIVAAYNEAFHNLEFLHPPALSSHVEPELISWHLYSVEIDFELLGITRAEFMTEMRENGIGTQVHYIPIYLQPYYRQNYGYSPGKCPEAEAYYGRALSLPLYAAMTDSDVQTVIDTVRSMCQRRSS
ncbi:UDP-4-amino-4,6-dideoxy-N-acetyl-beta-L-altrosamine transaminase [Blastopirellula marina]|uniref:UDP-4-amino-4, 6-dideoxy-N-acetyl-beta-L-altrosamine transaminase n=1 Tax=Blastopirellula marina TaxID=124 RepID=A0A2S8G2Y3_9BACT|nr:MULTISPECIES: UDP-4-amino-4,6-dideoxy-N-acetyl-beta-L-altrosamine transaminase [Pirellulaceae]PQO38797.1 UDP-4-amino-4,6-dideoxy-N-acetyl-beta-L-altrosamine transaminase [Blastopirellula marina]RCS55105.1 UDP-4-amino-4,6-dideoxy-N-acetyl-beta-L-altrosamine transaminase [Bremerella cremea]